MDAERGDYADRWSYGLWPDATLISSCGEFQRFFVRVLVCTDDFLLAVGLSYD